ncbi:MAG: DUF3572 domain-containing protein [Pseudomonadota bacterium]
MARGDFAETLALQALGWLAGQEDLLPAFMAHTGASEGDLKDLAADSVFLAAVLDFLMMEDAWLVAFCDHAGVAYDTVAAARTALPGGDIVHWT